MTRRRRINGYQARRAGVRLRLDAIQIALAQFLGELPGRGRRLERLEAEAADKAEASAYAYWGE